jgi:DNA-directed RNA polymerase specialized sigma24 family protein/preprotein translocase subunit Sss1
LLFNYTAFIDGLVYISINFVLILAQYANAKIDIWRKQNTYVNKGEKIIKKTDSLDQPLGSDDMDSGTLGDTISSDELSTDRLLEKNRARKIWNAINEFIKRAINFNFPDNPKYEQIYEMYTLHDMDIEEIAKALDLESGNIRIMKMRAEDAVQPFISDGTLSQFVMQATGEKIKDIPFIKGKGSSKMRFVFPRVKDSLKEGAEKVFSNILILKENEFVFDSTSFYKESENPDWIEYSQFILNESENKISFITKIYNQFNEINTMLNEDYDGNYNVDVVDLFEQVKQFVEESNRIISALYDEVHKLDNVAYSVQGEYPSISETISSSISPIVEKLEEWPNKLNFMLRSVRQKYNPTNAYGL